MWSRVGEAYTREMWSRVGEVYTRKMWSGWEKSTPGKLGWGKPTPGKVWARGSGEPP